MWIVCITSVRHVLTVNGYGGRQTKENEKSWCFKGWETLVIIFSKSLSLYHTSYINYSYTTVCCVIYVTFIYHSTITPSFSNTAEKDTKHIACFQQDSEI